MGISQDLGEFPSGFPWNEWGIFRRIGNAICGLIDLFRTNVASISSARSKKHTKGRFPL